jgi:hypothetical protein
MRVQLIPGKYIMEPIIFNIGDRVLRKFSGVLPSDKGTIEAIGTELGRDYISVHFENDVTSWRAQVHKDSLIKLPEPIDVSELRAYSEQSVSRLCIGDVVKYQDKFYIVESTGLGDPLELTPIMRDPARECLTVKL